MLHFSFECYIFLAIDGLNETKRKKTQESLIDAIGANTRIHGTERDVREVSRRNGWRGWTNRARSDRLDGGGVRVSFRVRVRYEEVRDDTIQIVRVVCDNSHNEFRTYLIVNQSSSDS